MYFSCLFYKNISMGVALSTHAAIYILPFLSHFCI